MSMQGQDYFRFNDYGWSNSMFCGEQELNVADTTCVLFLNGGVCCRVPNDDAFATLEPSRVVLLPDTTPGRDLRQSIEAAQR